LLAKLIKGAKLTIGTDEGTKEAVELLGAKHESTSHGEVTIDEQNLLFTTPCYMLDASIVDVANGAIAIVKEMIKFM
ncbi:MAG TPA: isoprenoid biosynthesis protein ElbB, partial [Bacteroidales bacterium]|nr:isoprenoid biosynthesis protein ElbB [Bacteroidales bacterium]